jgi:hypothetical protein
LMSAEDDRGFYLPSEEEIVAVVFLTGQVLLHRQVETQATLLRTGKADVNHYFLVSAATKVANLSDSSIIFITFFRFS